MKDRISLHPGRVRLVPVLGQEHTYDLVRADEPTQEGTALNKETLLKDATAAQLYGLSTDATPDDVFALLKLGSGYRAYSITLLYPDGTPASGFSIRGISSLDGSSSVITTNGNGKALGKSGSGSTNIYASKSTFLDFRNEQRFYISDSAPSSNVQIASWGTVVEAVLTLDYPTTKETTFYSSGTFQFSHLVQKADFCLVGGGGGGGGGGGSSGFYPGAGGGGGYVTNRLAINLQTYGPSIQVTVGSGGNGGATKEDSTGTAGSSGGQTKVVCGDLTITANGGTGGGGGTTSSAGSGGGGNGNGGNGVYYGSGGSGKNGTVYKFADSSLGIAGGGGGGGATTVSVSSGTISAASGGSPNGGSGAVLNTSTSTSQNKPASISATRGTVAGGGGGGGVGSSGYYGSYPPAAGAAGKVDARWYYTP